MSITDTIRNALVDSGKFDRVQYCGENQLHIEQDGREYVLRAIDDITGLDALFG